LSTSTTRAFSVYCRAKLNDAVNRVVKTHNALDYGDIGIFYISEKPNNMLSPLTLRQDSCWSACQGLVIKRVYIIRAHFSEN
jgi:hypothetical protein